MSIRPAKPGDDAFILGLAGRFSAFDLPAGRGRATVDEAIGRDLARHLQDKPDTSHFFVVEDAGESAGFVHLQMGEDFFGAGATCHVSDLAVVAGHEGRGLAGRLLEFSEAFARRHGCSRLSLAVFPGNERARTLYARHGFQTDLIRLGKPL